jgi:virginiamycin B lyase
LKTYSSHSHWANTALTVFRRKLFPSLCLGVAALLVLSSENATAQARSRFFPIREGSQPFDITMSADGNFWFTLSNGSKVARTTPHAKISYFVTPSLSNPTFITPGPDGNVWFGEGSTGKIAYITPAGDITELQFSFFGVSVGITTGPDNNIWFTDQTDHAVWRYDLSSGVFKRFKTPTPNSYPGDITTGPDGNMWFTEQAVDKFARITPSGVITEFAGVSSPTSIAAGPDGNIWVASAFIPQVARVTPAGDITFFPTPSQPSFIRPGTGDSLLFTEFSANKIASISMSGVVTESAEFVHSFPVGVTAGPKSQAWFLGTGNNRVYETEIPR